MQIIYLENRFNTLYAGLDKIEVKGVIVSDGKQGNYTTCYNIKVESINGDNKYKDTHLNLYIKNGEELPCGKRVFFLGEYSSASKATNYKAFDYANYLKTKYIYGNVNLIGDIKVSKDLYLNPILLFTNNIRDKIEENLKEILGQYSYIVKRHFTSEIQRMYQIK